VRVRRADDTRAALKVQMPCEEATAALIRPRAWNGDGIVRLLDHDPRSGAVLWERLDGSRTPVSVEDDDVAMSALAGLMARLPSVPAPEGLRGLGNVACDMPASVPAAIAALPGPEDRRRLHDWASAVAEGVDEFGAHRQEAIEEVGVERLEAAPVPVTTQWSTAEQGLRTPRPREVFGTCLRA